MIDNIEAPPIPQVEERLLENGFVFDLDSFVSETRDPLLEVQSQIASQIKGRGGFLTYGECCTEYSGWTFSPNEKGFVPAGGPEISKTIIVPNGNERDYLFTPILSRELFPTESGETYGQIVIGAHYTIIEGLRSTNLKYFIDEQNPSDVVVFVSFYEHKTPTSSFSLRIDRGNGGILDYKAIEFDYRGTNTESLVMQLVNGFSEFREMWLQTKDVDNQLESF